MAKARKRRSSATPTKQSTPRRIGIAPRLIVRMIGWAGTFVALGFAIRAMDAYAASRDVEPTRIEWVDLPEWLQSGPWADVPDSIERGEQLPRPNPIIYPDTEIRDKQVTPYVRTCIECSPWIERVERVTKLRDGRVRVHATFREPFAAVERDGIAYLIDSQGVRLPSAWRAEFDMQQHWMRIRGVRGRVPAIGDRWTGVDLQAALKLITFLRLREIDGKLPFRHELRGVDVSHYDEKIGGLRIITTNPRSYIYWGHVPGEGYGVEATAEEKLDTLREAYEKWGSLLTEWPFRIETGREITFVREPGT